MPAVALKRNDISATSRMPLLEALPVAVMLVDPRTFRITYVNAKSKALLRSIQSVLPVPAEAVVGQSMDIFHKDGARVRQHLSDMRNLPHSARIHAGSEILDLHVDAVRDARGNCEYLQLTWSVMTATVKAEARNARLLQMLEELPVNVMTCDRETLRIDYANKTSIETLRRIEAHLPIKADALIGTCIDVFHKNPHHQRKMLADASYLPHEARIRVGPETLHLRVTAITGPDGSYDGPMVTWSLITDNITLADRVTGIVSDMRRTSEAGEGASAQLLSLTERSEEMANTVSSSATEMSATFDEITHQIRRASTMSREVTERATASNALVGGLTTSVERISNVTALIEKIAAQTNLLALNATIEAARVGEAGKGFAVVAQEVKALALQTANATQDIRHQVEAVQHSAASAAGAVGEITHSVGELSNVFTGLSAAVDEQAAINRSVSESIVGVSTASSQIRNAATGVRTVAGEVSGFAERLTSEVETLLKH
ncbi:PAS domain-containing protein [Aquabacter sp. L1I39]|uniref:methyl-accepting chemotaxis protein n=1 Tax=Aquabacter sp. L1I39 TaxID=2820278 RepID=UPI001ADD2C85|nr:methyl-accepting chemotaxis protein [Aquabacter sp. L1I39]QTL05002.1 PAS domain-containing protein [Aquabacter sp. L1I39]